MISRIYLVALTVLCLASCESVERGPEAPASLAPPAAPAIAGEPVAVVGHPDPLSLLGSDDPILARNKRLVFDMWRGIVNAGHVELADELLAESYIQHSPVLPTGRTAFKQIFSAVPRLDEIPELVSPPLVSIIAEGPLVAMTLAETLPDPAGDGSYTSTHFNLFRIENGRLAEHWHSVQTAPGPEVASPQNGGPQPVTGARGIEQYVLLGAADPELAANKRLVFDMWRQIIDAGREELADIYLTEDYIQHNPNAATGRDGFRNYFAARPDAPIDIALAEPLVAMVAEGDLVVQALMQRHQHPVRAGDTYTTTWFDMFRIDGGRIAEHWDAATRAIAAEPAPPEAACESDGDLRYICGLSNAEDIVQIGTSRWLVASSINLRGQDASPGRLYLIDSVDRTAEELFPGPTPQLAQNAATFDQCPGIDLDAFDTHGLAIREIAPSRYRLYATSHGALEAIQAFEIDAAGARPAASWVGCVPLPADVWANSVAILADGGFVATKFMDPSDPDAFARINRGELTGGVYEWHPGGAVTEIPGTVLSGANGIELTPDGQTMFVASFGDRRVVRFSRTEPGTAPESVSVGVSADNLRWNVAGRLLTSGPNAERGTGWTVYEIDPATMSATVVIGFDETAALQSTATALQVGSELWFGTPGGDRVGYVSLN